MQCPHCSCALAITGSPCPRCGQAVESASSAPPFKSSVSNQPQRQVEQKTPLVVQPQQTTSAPQSASWMNNMTPLSTVFVICLILGLSYALIRLTPDPVRTSASASTPVAQAPNQTQEVAPAPTAVMVGPTFQQVDSTMDDRRIDLTSAQREVYWNTVAGKVINWTGTIHNVYTNGGGQISMQCNPNSLLSDVRATLDGKQLQMLPQLRKGQQVTVRGVLSGHSSFGYNITNAQIVP